MRPLLLAALLALPAIAAPLASAGPVPGATPVFLNAVYVDAHGAHGANFAWLGGCEGTGVARLAYANGTDLVTVELPARSTMQPDPCSVLCDGCVVPFAWTLDGPRVHLAGLGEAGGLGSARALGGTFDGGFLAVHTGGPYAPTGAG